MDDDHLRHICKLASIAVGGLRDREDWLTYVRDCSDSELVDHHTCLSILSKAFVELMNRADMKPKFSYPAATPKTEVGK
jgi:hypothetical protein